MTYRYSEAELAEMQKRINANLGEFQRNSGRGLPPATVEAMQKAQGVKLDEHGAPVPKPARKSKYDNVPTEVDGYRFASKLEAKYYVELELRRKAGEVLYYLRQVPFHLPGGVIYRVDFQIFSPAPAHCDDPRLLQVEYVDTKGTDTQDSKNKIKLVQALYGVKIEIVRKVKSLRSL